MTYFSISPAVCLNQNSPSVAYSLGADWTIFTGEHEYKLNHQPNKLISKFQYASSKAHWEAQPGFQIHTVEILSSAVRKCSSLHLLMN